MSRRLLIAALLALPLPAAAKRPAVPVAIPAGPAKTCISRSRIQSTAVRDDQTIDFFMRDGSVFRNRLPSPCPGLGFERAFGYATSIDQFCSVDIITVVRQSPPRRGASCGLGPFQPVTGLKR